MYVDGTGTGVGVDLCRAEMLFIRAAGASDEFVTDHLRMLLTKYEDVEDKEIVEVIGGDGGDRGEGGGGDGKAAASSPGVSSGSRRASTSQAATSRTCHGWVGAASPHKLFSFATGHKLSSERKKM